MITWSVWLVARFSCLCCQLLNQGIRSEPECLVLKRDLGLRLSFCPFGCRLLFLACATSHHGIIQTVEKT